MSIIVHKCRICGHTDLTDRSMRYDNTGDQPEPIWPRGHCGKTPRHGCAGEEVRCHPTESCSWSEPTLIRTFSTWGGKLERWVHEPGKLFVNGIYACACNACRALYAELEQT